MIQTIHINTQNWEALVKVLGAVFDLTRMQVKVFCCILKKCKSGEITSDIKKEVMQELNISNIYTYLGHFRKKKLIVKVNNEDMLNSFFIEILKNTEKSVTLSFVFNNVNE